MEGEITQEMEMHVPRRLGLPSGVSFIVGSIIGTCMSERERERERE